MFLSFSSTISPEVLYTSPVVGLSWWLDPVSDTVGTLPNEARLHPPPANHVTVNTITNITTTTIVTITTTTIVAIVCDDVLWWTFGQMKPSFMSVIWMIWFGSGPEPMTDGYSYSPFHWYDLQNSFNNQKRHWENQRDYQGLQKLINSCAVPRRPGYRLPGPRHHGSGNFPNLDGAPQQSSDSPMLWSPDPPWTSLSFIRYSSPACPALQVDAILSTGSDLDDALCLATPPVYVWPSTLRTHIMMMWQSNFCTLS